MSPTDNSGQQGPGPGGGFPAAQSPDPDPRQQRAAMAVAQIVQSARQLSMMFPSLSPEMREVTNLMSRAQQKMAGSQPAPETTAPPV